MSRDASLGITRTHRKVGPACNADRVRDVGPGSGAEASGGGLTRRRFLGALAGAGAIVASPRLAWSAEPSAFEQAARSSALVYVTPLRTDGSESRCHAEVWFVLDGADLLVVTNPERWRAAAVSRGLTRARLWVGEHGVWSRANEAWKASPTRDASAAIDADPKAHARALALFGSKYSSEWQKWGPRFEQGLASGDRVLIRYRPDPA